MSGGFDGCVHGQSPRQDRPAAGVPAEPTSNPPTAAAPSSAGLVIEVLRDLPDDRARRAYLRTLRRWAGHVGAVPAVSVLDALALREDPAELARLVALFRELGPGRAVRVEAAAALLRVRVDRCAAAERLQHRFGVSRATAYRDLAMALDAPELAHLSHPTAPPATC